MKKAISSETCLYGDAIPRITIDMEYIKKELGEIKSDLKSHIAEEDAMLHKLEDRFMQWMKEGEGRFASKQTEKLVNSLLVLIFMSAVGIILTTVLQHVGILK